MLKAIPIKEVISIIPDVTSLFLCYGAKVKSVLVIEKLKK